MKRFFFMLVAAMCIFSVSAQTQTTRKLRAWYDGMIIWQCDAALVDSLNFFKYSDDSPEGDNEGGAIENDSAQIFVGVVAFNKAVNQLPITTDVASAKTFITNQTNDQDFTAFAYSVSKGDKLFDAEGLPQFDRIFMLNFSDGTDNYSNMLWGMEGRMINQAYVYDTARYDLSLRAGLNSYAIGFGNDVGFGAKMQKVVLGSGKYHNAGTSSDLQTTFNEVAQSIIASAKNVVLMTNPGFYSEAMGYKYFRFDFQAEDGTRDTIYAQMDGTPFAGFTLSITKAGQYARFAAPAKGTYNEETGKVSLPLNNLKFVSGSNELQFDFTPNVSFDGDFYYEDVEEASTAEDISKRIAVVLVLDCSKSMGNAFEPMKEAAIDFIETLETIAPIVTLSVNDPAMGTVTGGGTYMLDAVATLTATANKGYQFVQWSDGNTSNPRTIALKGSIQLTAEFEALNNTINVSANESTMGSVTGGGTYKTGTVATLTATPKTGYQFVRWSDENTDNPRMIVVEEALALTAEFEALDNTITLSVNNEQMGTVSGGGIYKTGEVATITATPNENYAFRRWSDGYTANPREITVTEDLSLVAIFDSAFIDGHEYVDLGLPSGTLWATCNVGATSPEGYGDYFAWGETKPKAVYSWSTYKWYKGYSSSYGVDQMSKYSTNTRYGTIDNKQTLDVTDDAAYANWGGVWRMPIKAQWDELVSECTWTWTDNYNNTGREGYIITSTVPNNTNSIFLPEAGYRNNADLKTGSTRYWSSSLYYNIPLNGYALCGTSADNEYRYNGYPIRPVCASK